MFRKRIILSVLAACTALSPVAYAASPAAHDMNGTPAATDTAQPAAATAQPKAAEGQQSASADSATQRDFTKLSQDGFQAFRDIRMARLAIFEGQADAAGKLVEQASTALGAARTDETSFHKDVADIHPPKGAEAAAKAAGTHDETTQTAKAGENTEWLPIDGQVTLAEGYRVTPDNAQSVKDANSALQKGDRQGAVETLKLAGIDIEYVMALAPLENTVTQVQKAADDIKAGNYYEANLALKQAEDAIMVDAVDVVGTPKTESHAAAEQKPGDMTKQQQSASVAVPDKPGAKPATAAN